MKIDKDKLKEDFDSDFVDGEVIDVDDNMDENDDVDILDKDHLYTGGDSEMFENKNYNEVEIVLSESTKLTDKDGSIVLAGPGDIVTIKSEVLKRVTK